MTKPTGRPTGRPRKTAEQLKEEALAEELDLLSEFSDVKERNLAKKLLRLYLSDFEIENVADKNTLAQLIYLEINQSRLQRKMNNTYEQDANAIPLDNLEIMHKNADAITKLKTLLGLNRAKDRMGNYDALEHLKSRFRKYGQENQASRHLKCPHCYQMIWLKIRTDAWEALKHPFFQDTFLCNKPLMAQLDKTITITKEFLAEVFGVSVDYIDWLKTQLSKSDRVHEAKDGPNEGTGVPESEQPRSDEAVPGDDGIGGSGVSSGDSSTGTAVEESNKEAEEK